MMDGKIFTLCKMLDMQNNISHINEILSADYFDVECAKTIIDMINQKHPENIPIYYIVNGLANCGVGSRRVVFLGQSNEQQLKQDLEWKRYFLYGKASGKAFDKIIEEYNRRKN